MESDFVHSGVYHSTILLIELTAEVIFYMLCTTGNRKVVAGGYSVTEEDIEPVCALGAKFGDVCILLFF